MEERQLKDLCFGDLFGRQMRFIAGPRQVGKTTLAQAFLKERNCEALYYNWDKREIRARYRQEPYFFHTEGLVSQKSRSAKQWVCFDEIHKYPKWKNILKDFFDSFEKKYQFIVTGSARLDLFRKAGDALSGRYFLFKLLPFSLSEVAKKKSPLPTESAETFFEALFSQRSAPKDMEHLLTFSGFPEPFLKGNKIFQNNWQREYIDTLVKEDLRDLTQIHEVENVATLLTLLPERVGAPLSLNSLKEDLEVSYTATKNYLKSLILTYVLFTLPSYSKKINRSIKKEKKVYFFDWTRVSEPSKKFENYVAAELKNKVEFWSSSTESLFDLFYIRSRDGRETDFLVTRNGKPFFLVEAKLQEQNIASHHFHHAMVLGNIPLVQLLSKSNVMAAKGPKHYTVSADLFL